MFVIYNIIEKKVSNNRTNSPHIQLHFAVRYTKSFLVVVYTLTEIYENVSIERILEYQTQKQEKH